MIRYFWVLLLAASALAQTTSTGTIRGSLGALPPPPAPTGAMTAITDLATGTYGPGLNSSGAACNGSNGCTQVTFQGGLYPNGTNSLTAGGCGSPCTAHDTDGITRANTLHTNQTSEAPVVMLFLGFSNLKDEAAQFITDWAANGNTNQTSVKVLNAGQSGAILCDWTVATAGQAPTCVTPGAGSFNAYDNTKSGTLNPAGVTESQVQVVVFKPTDQFPESSTDHHDLLPCTGNGTPSGMHYAYGPLSAPVTTACTSNADMYYLEGLLGTAMRAMKTRYPNLKQVYLYSRIYAGYGTIASKMPSSPGGTCTGQCSASPERYAYESAFGIKALIAAQLTQCPTTETCNGSVDGTAGDLNYVNGTAAWIAWASYVWANGTTARADGLTWVGYPTDYQSDQIHPSVTTGVEKVASFTNSWGMGTFFLGSAYSAPWFHN